MEEDEEQEKRIDSIARCFMEVDLKELFEEEEDEPTDKVPSVGEARR